MAGKALKASGKRVMKYSRDGAVERDLLQQSETKDKRQDGRCCAEKRGTRR